MSIAPWLSPVLWREHDWRAALERVARELSAGQQSQRSALDLARACEYVEPDRRRAIAAYELAGPGADRGRARELAIELGWWSARARLTLVARSKDRDPRLILDEAEAWWDAGQPDLCTLALLGVPSKDRGVRGEELAAMVAERDLADYAAEAVARALSCKRELAADAYVMAARFSRAAGRSEDVTRWLEAALEADPRSAIAASFLLELIRREPDPAGVERFLRLRLADTEKDPAARTDRMRAIALALIDSSHHRGFGLRLLRQALESAYEVRNLPIPGHLAMWTVLAAHASADGTRRELLPLVIVALQACDQPVDRVWLGALATEISLRDANSPVVAGAYAEIVAEFAPEHPIVRELVAAVAATESEPATPVPTAAITAAAKAEESFDVDVDLDDTYAGAVEASLADEDLVEELDTPAPIPTASTTSSVTATPSSKPPPGSTPASSNASVKPITASELPRREPPAPVPIVAAIETKPKPSDVTDEGVKPTRPSIAPASITTPAPAAKSASIIPASISNPASMIPSALAKRTAATPAKSPSSLAQKLPPIAAAAAPVLAALRTPDRPAMPPAAATRSDAIPRARRISIPIDVRLVRADGTKLDAHSRDLSTSGLFVLTKGKLAVGDQLSIVLLLPGKEPFTEDEYPAKARVARATDDGYGLELIAPDKALIAALDTLE